jgi:aminoglycoside phosphotransferase (APT) family kinase protein
LLAVVDDVLYLEALPELRVRPLDAARHLGAWRSRTTEEHCWLAEPQLSQRVAAIDAAGGLDWALVGDDELSEVWTLRHDLLAIVDALPRVICHGDFSLGNLFRIDDHTTGVIDWGQLGWGPPGADLAALALSCNPLPDEQLIDTYVAGLGDVASAARKGFAATAALTGASRYHWMHMHGIRPAPEYRPWVLDRTAEVGDA